MIWYRRWHRHAFRRRAIERRACQIYNWIPGPLMGYLSTGRVFSCQSAVRQLWIPNVYDKENSAKFRAIKIKRNRSMMIWSFPWCGIVAAQILSRSNSQSRVINGILWLLYVHREDPCQHLLGDTKARDDALFLSSFFSPRQGSELINFS